MGYKNIDNKFRENGFDDSFQTYGCVSGVFQSAFAFGYFAIFIPVHDR
jgi:hypothetical protein